ncbi:MAG: hypothetical protein H6710_19130 [Myxococcales bacterium]|nr:hypothetical protein [Myxococcales bacterium]
MIRRARLLDASLLVTLSAGLTLAPIADAAAGPLGQRLRTVMTLMPDDEGAGEGEASEGEEPAQEIEEVQEAAPAPVPEGPAPAPYEPEPSKGLGMMITGAVITGVYALPMTFWGTWIIVASRRAEMNLDDQVVETLGAVVGGTILAFGIIGLGVGVPLLGVGAARFSRWREWKETHQARLNFGVGRTAFGTLTPSLTLRF